MILTVAAGRKTDPADSACTPILLHHLFLSIHERRGPKLILESQATWKCIDTFLRYTLGTKRW